MSKNIKRFTRTEAQAYQLLNAGYMNTDFSTSEINEAGNKIIEMAERIKAERAVIAMQPTS